MQCGYNFLQFELCQQNCHAFFSLYNFTYKGSVLTLELSDCTTQYFSFFIKWRTFTIHGKEKL